MFVLMNLQYCIKIQRHDFLFIFNQESQRIHVFTFQVFCYLFKEISLSDNAVIFAEYSILDCVYNEVERTFYVIDLTCWKGHPVYDSEVRFLIS